MKSSKVNERAKTATDSRKISSNSTEEGTMVGNAVPTMVNGVVNQNGNITEVPVNQEQLKAMEKWVGQIFLLLQILCLANISLANISLANISPANISLANDLSDNVCYVRLRRLQASLLDGGKRADDKDLKEKRLKKKKAAEKRLKVICSKYSTEEHIGSGCYCNISCFHCCYQGTWGGPWSCRRWGWGARQGGTNMMNICAYRFSRLVTKMQQNDNIWWKVYDDIQTELAEKTQALKKMKQRVKVRKSICDNQIIFMIQKSEMIWNFLSQGLNAEINDIQSEFEKDRQDYLDSIRFLGWNLSKLIICCIMSCRNVVLFRIRH